MNKETARYRRALRSQLSCLPRRKRQLLVKFEGTLFAFLEECPDPSYEQLEAAFGSPGEIASVLMEAVPEKEKRRYVLWQKAGKALLILCLIFAIVFGVYAYTLKEWTVIEYQDSIYEDVNETINEQDGV